MSDLPKINVTPFARDVTPKEIRLLQSGRAFLKDFTPPEYLIDGIYQRGNVYALTAPTGHGKTAVALYMLTLILRQANLAGRYVEAGKVLFLAGENPDDVRIRMMIAEQTYGAELLDHPNLWFLPDTLDLTKATDEIAADAATIGGLDYIFIDSSTAYFIAAADFDDENDNYQMGQWAKVLRGLTRIPGTPAVIVLCHPTKSATKESLLPRGGGAFLNEIDGNTTLWASEDRSTTELHQQGKFRGPYFDPIAFKLEEKRFDTIADHKGRPIPNVLASVMSKDQQNAAAQEQRSNEDALLEDMLNYPNANQEQRAERLGLGSKQRVSETMKTLVGDKLVKVSRNRHHLTKPGKAEAERVSGVSH